MENTDCKSVLGLKPRWLHDEERLKEVKAAMVRYVDAGIQIPKEWQKEYEELIREPHKMPSTVLKTSKEWMEKHPKTIIIDPDGWDRTNYHYSFFEERITEDEFETRLAASTCYLEGR